MSPASAWYVGERERFVRESLDDIVGRLANGAAQQGLHVEPQQHTEWTSSVRLLQSELADRRREIEVLRATLGSPELAEFRHVVLEYDFRRRGLRLDCVLLGDGVLAVVEFKRSRLTAADREQVTNYCINLVEFHEETRRLTSEQGCILAPVLALTGGGAQAFEPSAATFHRSPWDSVLRAPARCDARGLALALRAALDARRSRATIDCDKWLVSRFSPSSNILDAAVSLYGQHDVSAIAAHAAPVEHLERCTEQVAQWVERSLRDGVNRVVFVSGAPGAGKTLVGLKLAFDPRFREHAVFVTGNAPLVEVLSAALKSAYRKQQGRGAAVSVLSGYSREDAQRVLSMSTFKIVKAHAFLGHRGSRTESVDGRVVVFDEAQRTYEEGREVMRQKLSADEAVLILDSLTKSYGDGVAVVALVGHNQAINRGELGVSAWFRAVEARGWRFAIADATLELAEIADSEHWAKHPSRDTLADGHLPHSLRFYRNENIERWAEFALADDAPRAAELATKLDAGGDTIWLVRELADARAWAKERRVGAERAGIIASGQARRLAAEGLFVDQKPSIAHWMLAPGGDIRSGNMLETVQNQYQIQGLELDYTIVAWDLDLRRAGAHWRSYKLAGADWKRDNALEIAKNGYRVLLTRARKGMVLFVPRGDREGEDATRPAAQYDAIAEYLVRCGARPWSQE